MEEATKKRCDEAIDIAKRMMDLLNDIPDDDMVSIGMLAIATQGPFIIMKEKLELATKLKKDKEQENTGKAD